MPQAAMVAISTLLGAPSLPFSTITFVLHNAVTWRSFFDAAWLCCNGRMVLHKHPLTKREAPDLGMGMPPAHISSARNALLKMPLLESAGSSSGPEAGRKQAEQRGKRETLNQDRRIFAVRGLLQPADCERLVEIAKQHLGLESVAWSVASFPETGQPVPIILSLS